MPKLALCLLAAAAHAYAPRAAPRGPARLAATTTTTPEVDAANPFAIVGEDLKNMKQRIKALVERSLDGGGGGSSSKSGGSHPLLQEAAREFFERRERAFRPAVVLLVARAVEGTASGKTLPEKQCLLAEIVEMMCTAQVVHDSVLEDDEAGSTGNVAHRTYSQNAGNKVSVLAGDFLLARCSVALSELGESSPELVTRLGACAVAKLPASEDLVAALGAANLWVVEALVPPLVGAGAAAANRARAALAKTRLSDAARLGLCERLCVVGAGAATAARARVCETVCELSLIHI